MLSVKKIFLLFIEAQLLLASISPARADIAVTKNQAIPNFPREIRFVLSAQSDTEIGAVELEFGTDALTCGQSTYRVVPEDFEPGISIEVEWVWDFRQTGATPPGTVVWWRWRMTDIAGEVLLTPEMKIELMDESVDWQTVGTDSLLIHWYEGDAAFAGELLEAGQTALNGLLHQTGVDVEKQINVYIYASSDAMQSATLFAPAWSGGLAFPEHNTVLIAIAPDQPSWGKRAIAHELAHVVIDRYIFSCISNLPVWLSEGLAENAEGEMDAYYQDLLSEAVENNTLLSVRELGEIFSNDPERASLSYAQSNSLVAFLIENYGQERMLLLLDQFREGTPPDRALLTVYDLDRDGLEAAWREHIGASPMESAPTVGPTPTHTPYPTFAPITGPEIKASSTSKPTETLQPNASPIPPDGGSQYDEGDKTSSILIYVLIIGGGAFLIIFIGWYLLRRRGTD